MARYCTRQRFRILAYHGVDDLHDPVVNFDGFQVPLCVFKQQLELVARHFKVWPLSRITKAVIEGSELPDNLLVLTFDDGYRNNLVNAAPILKEYGMPATFFITTGFVDGTHKPWWYQLRTALSATRCVNTELPNGRCIKLVSQGARIKAIGQWEAVLKKLRDQERWRKLDWLMASVDERACECPYPLMDWDDIKRLTDSGFDIGPHTMSHIDMAVEDRSMIASEVRISLERIRIKTGFTPRTYSYPYGRMTSINDEIKKILTTSGIVGAVTTKQGMNNGRSDLLMLKRLNITGNHQLPAFEALVSGLTACGPI